MSVRYSAILWNRQKKIYDIVLAGLWLGYLAAFLLAGAVIHPNATAETLLIRALGTLAFLMLHVVLCIGPLCRLDRRFLPLLYNRRHLGVATFLTGLAHGGFSLVQFHAFGDIDPLRSLLTSNTQFANLSQFPFQLLGFLALIVLFLMAATSHDLWLHLLTPPVWKCLHMMVYVAYGLLVGHVALGALQSETSRVLVAVVLIGLAVVCTLHVLAGSQEKVADENEPAFRAGFVEIGSFETIPEKRAKIVSINGERIAVFRHDGKVSAVSNVCRHQNGPLGEGKIIDGCITCPWHGYQYIPETGASPPPFTDKVSTYETRMINGKVLVKPCPR